MKKTLMKLILLMAVLLFMATNACAHPSSQREQVPLPPQADTIEVMSQAMGRNIKNVVIVPEKYFIDSLQDAHYPVLYLLHGAMGCYSDWTEKGDIDALANRYDCIIVCPDGQDSWYVDSPVDPKMQFETYVSKELVEYIVSHYRTIANRYMRAITGLSMGGHGALSLAWKHPDVFWSCGSMSGCTDITNYPDSWRIKERLGVYADNQQRWKEHSVYYLASKLKSSPLKPAQNIIIDDGLKDIFIKDNIALHDYLVEQGIDHDFTVRPGRHSWDYWVNALDYHMVFFSKAFARGLKLMEQEATDTNN